MSPFIQIGPFIEVYRIRRGSAHLEDGYTYVRRDHGRGPVLQRRVHRARSPDIIEIDPDEYLQRRYRSPAPSPEIIPRQNVLNQYFHTIAGPAAPPPNPLGDRIAGLTARTVAVEAEIRELREEYFARQAAQQSRPRRCTDCGRTSVLCQCGTGLRTEDGRAGTYGRGSVHFNAERDVNIIERAPRRSVRFADDEYY